MKVFGRRRAIAIAMVATWLSLSGCGGATAAVLARHAPNPNACTLFTVDQAAQVLGLAATRLQTIASPPTACNYSVPPPPEAIGVPAMGSVENAELSVTCTRVALEAFNAEERGAIFQTGPPLHLKFEKMSVSGHRAMWLLPLAVSGDLTALPGALSVVVGDCVFMASVAGSGTQSEAQSAQVLMIALAAEAAQKG
ncbi:MAG: hypothetical protein ACRDYC_03435 [Acidimicrobiales bacterium]